MVLRAWSVVLPLALAAQPATEPAAREKLAGDDPRVQRAMEHFTEGKRLFQANDRAGARREFDKAVDLLLAAAENMPDRAGFERRFEDLIDRIYHYDLEAAANPGQPRPFDKSPLDEIRDLTFPVDPRLKTKVLEEIAATQSQLPLVVNDSVISFINYFNTERGRRTLIAGYKRAGRYKDMISRILAEEGLPLELIYLAQAESGFSPRAVSYMAAAGMWQFVQFRGQEYGLRQSAYHDDRLDPEKATRAAARHLKDLYNQFGDWHLAMAAYNCGPGCVDAAVTRTGYADFWELKSRGVLPRETMNYVPIIIATTIIMKNARDYGLEGIEVDAPLQYETVMLDSITGLQLVADILDLPVTELREMNPPLLGNAAPAGYELRVPVGTGGDVKLWLARVPADKRQLWRVHRMGAGETLDEVAKRNRTTPALTLAANPDLAGGSEILPGQTLIVPMAPEPPRPAYRYVWSRGRRVAVPVYPQSYRASNPAVKPAPNPITRSAVKAPVKSAAKAPARKPAASAKPAVKR